MNFTPIRRLSFILLLATVSDVESSEDCGKIFNGANSRIINGTKADDGEFIWMVHVIANGEACGGSIITSKWVMTAAHCFKKVKKGAYANVMFVIKQYGMTLRSTSKDQRIKVADVVRHPEWNALTLKNDIALMQAQNELVLDNKKLGLGRICLPVIDVPLNTQTKLTVIGWGTTNYKPTVMSHALMKVDLNFCPLDECKNAYGKKGQYLTDTQICTRTRGKDSCQGDSGGPLFTTVNGRYVQVGIVSAGIGCADFQYPAYYTKVSRYVEWIKTTTKSKFDYQNLLDPKSTTTTEKSTTKSSKSSCPDEMKNIIRKMISLILSYYVLFSYG